MERTPQTQVVAPQQQGPESTGQEGASLLGPEGAGALQLQAAADGSPQVQQLKRVQEAANASPQVRQLRRLGEGMNQGTLQRKENKTGLPDDLKSGVENLSGLAMDDVKVHYNSDKPAQLQAHAYAQGSDIHVAPGQERHLAHEAWHVAQQKQGRVQATTQLKGTGINDDKGLEREADVMGAKALQLKADPEQEIAGDGAATSKPVAQKKSPVQRMIALNATTLYYNKPSLGFTSDRTKQKTAKEAEWATNIESGTGLTTTDITGDNFIGLKRLTGWSATVQGAIKQKLENNKTIFEYTDATFLRESDFIRNLSGESKKNVLVPNDFLDETTSISGSYDVNLACVLQALINAGATLPDYSGQSGSDNYKKFHNYMVNNGYTNYDLDHVIYKYYTSIGLNLVLNTKTAWKDITLPKGSYVFTRKGHNFAVSVSNNGDAPDKHVIDDRPQSFTTYNPDMEILYVWKV